MTFRGQANLKQGVNIVTRGGFFLSFTFKKKVLESVPVAWNCNFSIKIFLIMLMEPLL